MCCYWSNIQNILSKQPPPHSHSSQSYLGNHFSTAFLVSSGCLVGFWTHFNRLQILWTWVSTPIPVSSPHATSITMWAIFGPTPGSCTNSLNVGGMSESYFCSNILVVFLMKIIFFCSKRERERKHLRYIKHTQKSLQLMGRCEGGWGTGLVKRSAEINFVSFLQRPG